MPTYEFLNEDETKYTVLFFEMKSAPKIGESIVDDDGTKWKRIPSMPQAASNMVCNPFSSKDFVKKTGQMKGTWGEMSDFSAEMSERRAAANGGVDVIKEKYFEERKKLTGLEHHEVKKRKAKENLAKKGITLE